MYPPPNGYFAGDFIVYGSLEKGGTVSRGFRLFPPDTKASSEQTLAALHENLVRYLQSVPDNQAVQWKWRKDSDYSQTLDYYDAQTARVEAGPIRAVREQASGYFRDLMNRKELRREHLEIYPCITLDRAGPLIATSAGLAELYRAILAQLTNVFAQIHSEIFSCFGGEIVVTPMTAEDHFLRTYLFYNPDFTGALPLLRSVFDPADSILTNCQATEIDARNTSGRLYFGGHYHGIVVLEMLGSHTYETMIQHLTKAEFIDYEITVNLRPLDTRKLIEREERESQALQRQEVDDQEKQGITSPSRRSTVRLKEALVDKLSGGLSRFFAVTFAVRVWAPNEILLTARMSAIKTGALGMKNMRVLEQHLPPTALDLLYLTLPGNAFHRYAARETEIADEHLANLIPFSASFNGDLDQPQALYRSSDGGLVGVRLQKHNVPQHTAVLGASRSGKSFWFDDLLHQTAPYFAYDVIVESGLTHLPYSRAFDLEPIVIRRDGTISINYLDTGGLPLSKEHLGLAITQALQMTGKTDDRRLFATRKAYLTHYVSTVLDEAADNWLRLHPEAIPRVQREACAVHHWHKRCMKEDDTPIEAYTDLKAKLAAKLPAAIEFMAGISDSAIQAFTDDRATAHVWRNHVFSYFQPEDYPRHSDLFELVAFRPKADHDSQEIQELAGLLREWTADRGSYGPLFDGVTNCDLGGRVVHFELGVADKTDRTLKIAASLTIAGKIRQHIIRMPRSVPKRFTWEEFAADMDVPDNDKLASELIAQLAKYNCVFTYIIQNYGQFRDSPVAAPLLGNTSQFFLFRQEDPKDIADLGARIHMPESLRDAVSKYRKVVNMPAGGRFSRFCYFSRAAFPEIAGSCDFHPAQSAVEQVQQASVA